MADETPEQEIKYMPLDEFVAEGFLQEANRLFFHPRGLALSVETSDEGAVIRFGRIWDYRDDPEGLEFGEGVMDPQKTVRVEEAFARHYPARVAKWPDGIQPEKLPSE